MSERSQVFQPKKKTYQTKDRRLHNNNMNSTTGKKHIKQPNSSISDKSKWYRRVKSQEIISSNNSQKPYSLSGSPAFRIPLVGHFFIIMNTIISSFSFLLPAPYVIQHFFKFVSASGANGKISSRKLRQIFFFLSGLVRHSTSFSKWNCTLFVVSTRSIFPWLRIAPILNSHLLCSLLRSHLFESDNNRRICGDVKWKRMFQIHFCFCFCFCFLCLLIFSLWHKGSVVSLYLSQCFWCNMIRYRSFACMVNVIDRHLATFVENSNFRCHSYQSYGRLHFSKKIPRIILTFYFRTAEAKIVLTRK